MKLSFIRFSFLSRVGCPYEEPVAGPNATELRGRNVRPQADVARILRAAVGRHAMYSTRVSVPLQ